MLWPMDQGIERRMFDADTGNEGGTGQGDTGDATGGSDTQNGGSAEAKTYTQDELNHMFQERVSRARKKWETDQEEAKNKADADAEAKRLADEKKFQELATQHETRANTLQGKLDEANAIIRGFTLRQAFELEAGKQKLAFATEQARIDAFDLLDQARLDIDDAGTVTGMEAAVKALKGSRPYLFGQAQGNGSTSIDAAQGRGAGEKPDPKAREADLRQRFRI